MNQIHISFSVEHYKTPPPKIRLIGDENYPNVSNYNLSMRTMSYGFTANKPPNLCKISAFTVYPFYNKGDELLPAGLKGPVRILPIAEQRLKP